ncbi:lambda exonuclease family protein [Methylobacterium komagatae]
MSDIELIQGSEEWLAARVGSLGASRVADAIAKTKTGYGASRANLMAELIAERLTGQPADKFTNAAMQWGNEKEPDARTAYEFMTNADVVQVGIVRHPSIHGTHASPDGLVGGAGLVEIKAPNTNTHIETLLTKKVPEKYVTQMQWQMSCTGRKWCDFVSFDPRMPERMRLFVKRFDRDDDHISRLEIEVAAFLNELEGKMKALTDLYMEAPHVKAA